MEIFKNFFYGSFMERYQEDQGREFADLLMQAFVDVN